MNFDNEKKQRLEKLDKSKKYVDELMATIVRILNSHPATALQVAVLEE